MKNEIARIDNDFAQKARYKLNTKEHKFLFYIISHLDPINETDFDKVLIPFSKIQETLVGDKDNYNALYDEIDRLRESLSGKGVTFPSDIFIGKRAVKGTRNFFQAVEPQLNENGEKCLAFIFSPIMKPFLLQLSKYVRISMGEILPMSSTHAIRMYTVFKSEKDRLYKAKENFTITYTIDQLKQLLGIEDKYTTSKFNDFKINVLDKIVFDINFNSKIMRVEYTYVKMGRKITGVKFHVDSSSNEGITVDDLFSPNFPNLLGFKVI